MSVGELVVRSNQALPFSIPSITPLVPSATASDLGRAAQGREDHMALCGRIWRCRPTGRQRYRCRAAEF
jgi:hypothetical protein